MTLLYLCGRVTGMPNDNLDAFENALAKFAPALFTPVVPHYHTRDDRTWDAAMRTCITQMLRCDGVCLIDEADSRGCLLERMIAEELGMPVKTLDEWLDIQQRVIADWEQSKNDDRQRLQSLRDEVLAECV